MGLEIDINVHRIGKCQLCGMTGFLVRRAIVPPITFSPHYETYTELPLKTIDECLTCAEFGQDSPNLAHWRARNTKSGHTPN